MDNETLLYTGQRDGLQEIIGNLQEVLRESILKEGVPNTIAFLEEMKAVAALATVEKILEILGSLDEANVVDVFCLANSYMAGDNIALKAELKRLAEGYTTPHRDQPSVEWLRLKSNLSKWLPFKANFDAFMTARLKSTSGV